MFVKIDPYYIMYTLGILFYLISLHKISL